MTIEKAAVYLHIELNELKKFVRQGEIPFAGDEDHPFFNEDELDAWASRRIMNMSGKNLADFDKDAAAAHKGEADFTLSCLISPDRIFLDFDAKTKNSVISGMVDYAESLDLLYDPKDLYETLREREELCSTGLAGGFAILHPRFHDSYLATESFLLFARASRPVHFGAPDGKPTDLFFALVCSEDRVHLRALARLCMLLSDEKKVAVLRNSDTPEEIVNLF